MGFSILALTTINIHITPIVILSGQLGTRHLYYIYLTIVAVVIFNVRNKIIEHQQNNAPKLSL